MGVHHFVDVRQAQATPTAVAAPALIEADESIENTLAIDQRNTLAVVTDSDHREFTLLGHR
mgnify:CR=1 FL=1